MGTPFTVGLLTVFPAVLMIAVTWVGEIWLIATALRSSAIMAWTRASLTCRAPWTGSALLLMENALIMAAPALMTSAVRTRPMRASTSVNPR